MLVTQSHKAKAIDEKLLGLQHPLLSSTYSNLGYVYREKGDDELSQQYYDKAKSIAGS
jgi:tetratricopeptide (TPR) repeat protein